MGEKAKQRCILTAGIVTLFWGGVLIYSAGKASRQEPDVVLWSPDYYDPDPEVSSETGEVHRRLEKILPEVNFHETPFGEAVGKLEDSIREASPAIKSVTFRIAKGVPLEAPINLKLKDVPVGEALRYVAALNQCRYKIRAGRVIELSLLSSPNREEAMDGWFSIPPEFFAGIDQSENQNAIREVFESAGIPLATTDSLDYFPDRSLLRASTSHENLELINAYSSSYIICYTPTWRDHLLEWWHLAKIKLRLVPAPLPITPPSPALTPDPFGVSPSTGIGTPPDPFGN